MERREKPRKAPRGENARYQHINPLLFRKVRGLLLRVFWTATSVLWELGSLELLNLESSIIVLEYTYSIIVLVRIIVGLHLARLSTRSRGRV